MRIRGLIPNKAVDKPLLRFYVRLKEYENFVGAYFSDEQSIHIAVENLDSTVYKCFSEFALAFMDKWDYHFNYEITTEGIMRKQEILRGICIYT